MSYIGRSPQIGGYHKLDNITCDGSTAYTMQLDSANFVPESANHLIVSVNGVIQAPTTSFTVSSSTITFASALSSSDTIDFIMALGNVLDIGTPSDGTISASKLATTSITGQTAETSANDSDSLLIYDDSATALRKMTRANFLSGVGGTNTPAFHAYLSSPQTGVSDGVLTKCQFNAESFDTDNCYDNSSNYRFTPNVAGKYYVYSLVSANALSASNVSLYLIQIRKNGAGITQGTVDYRNNANAYIGASFNAIVVDMNGTSDYLEVFSHIDTANNQALQFQAGPAETYFGAYRIIE